MTFQTCPDCQKKGLYEPQKKKIPKGSWLCKYCRKIFDGPPKMSTDFSWDTDQWEEFCLMGLRFNVTKAKRILSKTPHPMVSLPLNEDLKNWVKRPKNGKLSIMSIYVDWQKIDDQPETYDLEHPIIVAELPSGIIPIDGWHRIAKAFDDGIDKLPSFILTPKETKSIS